MKAVMELIFPTFHNVSKITSSISASTATVTVHDPKYFANATTEDFVKTYVANINFEQDLDLG